MRESISRAHAALEAVDAGQSLFDLIEQSVGRSQTDRALFDAIAETWLANDEIREVHEELISVLDALVRRAQEAGAIRTDISAIDVMMMIKGVCEVAGSFQHLKPDVMLRQLDLVRAAISAPGAEQRPLRGAPPSLEDLEQAKKAHKAAAATHRAATA